MTTGPRAGTIAAVGAVAAWVLYVYAASGRLGWADASELAAAGQQLGIAHAPGEPVYLLLVRLAQLLPVGDLAARAVWLSSALSAAVVGLAVVLVGRLLPADGPRATALVFTAIATACCGALWTQGIVVELYSLAVLALLSALILTMAAAEHPGAALGAGLALGLATAINPLMAVLSGPAVLVAAVLGPARPGARAVALAGVGLLLGCSTLLYLPLRNAAQPGVWANALDDPAALLAYATGRTYGRSFGGGDGPGFAAMAVEHVRLLASWLGLPALLLGAGGLVFGMRDQRRGTLGVLALGVGALGATMTRSTLETFTPDLAGYLLPTCMMLLIGGALAVARVGRRAPVVALVLAVGCGLGVVIQGVATVRSHRNTVADSVALALLEATPAGGVLITGSDSTALPVLYAVTTGRRRPDVLAVAGYGTPAEVLRHQAQRHPHLALDPGPSWDAVLQEQHVRDLVAAGRGTGVVGTVLLWPPELVGSMEPAGLGLAVTPGSTARSVVLRREHERIEAALIAPLWDASDLAVSRPLRRLLGSTASQHAAALLDQGRHEEAIEVLRGASAVHPDPTAMVHLQRSELEQGVLVPTRDWPPGTSAAAGHAALQRGDPLAALPGLERAVEELSSSPDLWEDLATARFWTGDLQGASSAWSEALQLRPGSPWALAGQERLYSMGAR